MGNIDSAYIYINFSANMDTLVVSLFNTFLRSIKFSQVVGYVSIITTVGVTENLGQCPKFCTFFGSLPLVDFVFHSQRRLEI